MNFEDQFHLAYSDSACKFGYSEALQVFQCYFAFYELHTHRAHPRIRTAKIIEMLNDIDGDGLFEAENYPAMIEAYFCTRFKNCDRNVCHFFSGKIRELRFYERCY